MKFRERSERTPSVELTPLIDVVFLLLIFFMVSTTFISRSGLQVQVPEAETGTPNPDRSRIEVMVTDSGEYLVNGKGLGPGQELEAALRARLEKAKGPSVLVIRADRESRHADVVGAMDAGRAVGLNRIAISTIGESPESSP